MAKKKLKLYESTKTVHLDGTLHKLCKRIAEKEHTPLQDVINTGIREFVNKKLREDFF